MYNPPPSFDDTQPRPISTIHDTHPHPPQKKQPRSRRIWLLLWLLGIFSLVITVGWWLGQPNETPTPVIALQTVTIQMGDEPRTIQTTAQTVGDLLMAEGITITEQDALSHDVASLLSDNFLLTIDRARDVMLTLDGNITQLRTPFTSAYDILRQANVTLQDSDRLQVNGQAVAVADILTFAEMTDSIDIQRAFTISIVDDGIITTRTTTANTVGDVLFEANISVIAADIVEPIMSATLSPDTEIMITRGIPITIDADDVELAVHVPMGTVGDALASAGVILNGLDYVLPVETTPITDDMTIEVFRVTETIESQDVTIPFDSVMQADANLELDTRAVIQSGQNGISRESERVLWANGVEISREPAGNEVIQAPVNEVIGYGTNIILRTINTPEGPREYWRKLRVYATAYSPDELGGDNITSIGETLRRGIVAADPKIIPYRTNVFVAGYGTGFIADTGGPRSSPYWIDLGFGSGEIEAWHQYTDIYLLTPVPANLNYLLPNWTPMRGLPDNGN